MAEVVAAGTVPVRWDRTGRLEVALVHRPRYDDWSLPKGHLEPGEHPAVAALRETAEESGLSGALTHGLGRVRYQVRDRGSGAPVDKTVHYWAMPVLAGDVGSPPAADFVPNGEVDELAWLGLPQARARLSRRDDHAPLAALAAIGVPTTTVLLVRHGRAGSRRGWPGPDDLRPLDETGRNQAQAIARIGACFGVGAVFSPELTRCIETVAPLAHALGLPLQFAPQLGEEGFDARIGVATVLAWAAAGVPAAACSQGGALPGLLSAMPGPVALPDLKPRKGSMWVLSFAAGELLAADYLQDARPTVG